MRGRRHWCPADDGPPRPALLGYLSQLDGGRRGEVRIGIIGTSWWADAMYLPALADHPRRRHHRLCGRDPDRTRACAARWGVAQVHTDWLEMVDSGRSTP